MISEDYSFKHLVLKPINEGGETIINYTIKGMNVLSSLDENLLESSLEDF